MRVSRSSIRTASTSTSSRPPMPVPSPTGSRNRTTTCARRTRSISPCCRRASSRRSRKRATKKRQRKRTPTRRRPTPRRTRRRTTRRRSRSSSRSTSTGSTSAFRRCRCRPRLLESADRQDRTASLHQAGRRRGTVRRRRTGLDRPLRPGEEERRRRSSTRPTRSKCRATASAFS